MSLRLPPPEGLTSRHIAAHPVGCPPKVYHLIPTPCFQLHGSPQHTHLYSQASVKFLFLFLSAQKENPLNAIFIIKLSICSNRQLV